MLLAVALAAPPSALAGDKEDAALEKTFRESYAAAVEDADRARVVATLATAPDASKVRLLVDGVLKREPAAPVQAAAVKVLGAVTDERLLKEIVADASGKGDFQVRGVLIEALGRVDSPLAVDGLVRMAKGEDTKTVAAALFALAERKPPEGRDVAKKGLEHKSWQVRLGALDYLQRLNDATTLPWIVDLLEEETGRMREECIHVLKRITGKDYERDVVKWRAFAAGGEAAVAALGSSEPAPAKPASADGAAVSSEGDAPPPTYYGLKVYSDRVVFVVDLSLSMNDSMTIDRDKMARETGAVTSGSGASADPKKDPEEIQGLEWWKIRSRMDFARAQMKHVVSMLGRDQWFDIVWFSESVVAWQGQMIPANPANKARAAAWLDSLKCEGGTNTWGGLTKALNLVGRGTDEENYRRGADTLYFMSDGQPSKGDIIETDKIVAAMERIHKVRRVKINVVQIGTSRLPFMEDLARVTGGAYKFFDAKAGEK